ncbi:MAG: ROK family protein [Acidobacteriaceae bacterium]
MSDLDATPLCTGARYVFGADIGATNLRLALADATGAIIGRWVTSTADVRSASAVVELICAGAETLLLETGVARELVVAIAAGGPGITDVDRGVVVATSYLMGWSEVPLGSMLERALGIPAAIDNDVNLAALGESWAGSGQGVGDFVFVGIGTGIGAGIVLDGKNFRGSGWTAGEIGYMLVPGGSEAPVERGRPGSLEEIAGGAGIQSQWKELWREDATSLPRDATATQIFDDADRSALAQSLLQKVAKSLAYAVYNTALVLNCPLFVFGGGVGVHPVLRGAVQELLHANGARVQPKLVPSALGEDAQLIGAICLALRTAGLGSSAILTNAG